MLGLLLLQVLASCLWLGHSEVMKSFASCHKFFYMNTTPDNALELQNPAWICQRYKNQYHFATLYDTDLHIPVYSAYIYQPGRGNRSKSWFVEPQAGHVYNFSQIHVFSNTEMKINGILTIRDFSSGIICFITSILNTDTFSSSHPIKLINTTYSKDMDTEKSIENRYNITLQQIAQSQAVTQDYNNLTGLYRGHLSSSGHQSGNNNKTATFTLTNRVPQNSTLNKGAWKDYENQKMSQKAQGCTDTYVIVGAVPGSTYISNKRVNVPSHIWSAACCQTNIITKTWTSS